MLLVSDLHYTLKQLDWVAAVASDYDVVVLAGDHLDIASIVEPDAQIAVTLEYLARMSGQTTVIASSGNHDLNARNPQGERVAAWLNRARRAGIIVDGTQLDTDEVLVTVCPWWDGPVTRDLVDRQLADDATRAGARMWIWVYHAPPAPSRTSWTGKRYYGDEELTAWIERFRPAVVLCGHVHQSPFASDGGWCDRIGSTLVLNAGRQRGPLPAFVEVDTDAGTARWCSLEGVEEAALVAEPA